MLERLDGWVDEIGEYDPLQGMLPVVCTLIFEMWVQVLKGIWCVSVLYWLVIASGACNVDFSM